MLTFRLLDQFRALFDGVKYLSRRSTQGDKIAVCLYEDLLVRRKSVTLIRGIENSTLVLNTRNRRVGVNARRGDGTFGSLVGPPLAVAGFAVARGEVSTVEIGVEVKVISRTMSGQRDRVASALEKQAQQFRTKANNPVCVGIVGINWADRYTNYEGQRTFFTDGRAKQHPVQEAVKTERWLSERLDTKYDELIFLRYRARNEDPFLFAWVDHIVTRNLYEAALARIASSYEGRFGAVHSRI